MQSSPGEFAHRGSMTPTSLAKSPLHASASPMHFTPPPSMPYPPMELIVQRVSNLESLCANLSSGNSSHSGCAPLSAMLSHGDQINKLVAGLDFLNGGDARLVRWLGLPGERAQRQSALQAHKGAQGFSAPVSIGLL
eukprot:504919-Pelagomonas_calceolata.AAC.1